MKADRFGAVLVVASAIAFSAKAIFVKLAYAAGGALPAVDPVTLLAMRMLLALPFFAAIAWWAARHNQYRLTRRDWAMLAATGLMGYYGASLLDFWGLQYISAALERLVLFLNPTIVVLISAVFVGYRIVRRDVFALIVSYLGIVLVFLHDLRGSDLVLLGGALVLGSAVLYAGYQVSAGQMIRRLGAVRFAAYASIVSTIAIALHCLVTTGFGPMFKQPAPVWTLTAWMAIVSTVLPVAMMAEGIRRVGSSNAAMMSSIGPIATIFMGYAFLNEPITAIQLAGAALVTAGVLAISLKPAATSKPVQ